MRIDFCQKIFWDRVDEVFIFFNEFKHPIAESNRFNIQKIWNNSFCRSINENCFYDVESYRTKLNDCFTNKERYHYIGIQRFNSEECK